MVSKDGKPRSKKPRSGAAKRTSSPDARVEREAQRLTWNLLDDHIADKQRSRLETLLLKSGLARRTYVYCVQLHVDLMYYFAEEHARKNPRAKKHFLLRTKEFITSLMNGAKKKVATAKR